MSLIVDAAPLVALADTADRMREPVRQALAADPGPLVIPAPVTAEVDYGPTGHPTGVLVLTVSNDRISAITRFLDGDLHRLFGLADALD